jgi:hypothetical protein
MAIINSYLTLAEYKRGAGIDDSTDSDATDDLFIESLLEEASRFIDDETCRTFYPRVETHYLDTPDCRELWLDDDLLEIIDVTNGDDSSLDDSSYFLIPRNATPYYAIRIIATADETFELDSTGNAEGVIEVEGIWGYHTNYSQRAWMTGSTVNSGAVTAAATSFVIVSGTLFDVDQIIRLDDELARITATAYDDSTTYTTLTIARGENGSTAAAHDDSSTVYIWQTHPPAKTACRAIVQNEYKKRHGANTEGAATITGAGVVITPDSIPRTAARIIRNLKRAI